MMMMMVSQVGQVMTQYFYLDTWCKYDPENMPVSI